MVPRSLLDIVVLFLILAPMLMFAFGLAALIWIEASRPRDTASAGPNHKSESLTADKAVKSARRALKQAEKRSEVRFFFFLRRLLARLTGRRR